MPVETVTTFYVILFFVCVVGLIFVLSLFMQRRAVNYVVGKFREKNALKAENGIEHDELGIKHQHALIKKRDYRPQALQLLMQMNVVKSTDEGRLYFSEDKYASIDRESSPLVKILLPK